MGIFWWGISTRGGGADVRASPGQGFLTITDSVVSWLPQPVARLVQAPVAPDRVSTTTAARKVLRMTLVLSAIAVTLLVVVHLVNALAWGDRFPDLDADNDTSVWSWASVATESFAAGVLGLLTLTSARSAALRFCTWVVVFLSLDDFIRIHEKIGAEWSIFPHAARTMWPLIYLPLLASLMVLLWRVAQGLTDTERFLIRAGLLALVVAVCLETLTPLLFAIGQGHGSPGYEIEVAIEESLELGGWMWIAGGLASGLLLRQAVEAREVDATAGRTPAGAHVRSER
jgi:hypothetical protein